MDDDDDEEEEELEIQREWAEAGVFSDGGSGMPDGEPLPGDRMEAPFANPAAAEPFAKVGISEFVSTGLGMGPNWRGER